MDDWVSVITATSNAFQALAALAAATGLTGWVVKDLQAKGINTQNLLNNKWIAAAERAAQSAITDIVLQGKSPTDPKVIQDVIAAVTASFQSTHAETQKALGASDADTARVVTNAVRGAVQNTMPKAPASIGSAVAEVAADPVAAAQQAKDLLTSLHSVLNPVPTAPATV
jgi:hypothetical protein